MFLKMGASRGSRLGSLNASIPGIGLPGSPGVFLGCGVCLAAKEDPVFEFGLRRAQGIDGALTASRAAYLGGCASTSNVLAGKLFGIPVGGTQAHSWIMAYEKEQEAFDEYAKHMPENTVFLVDTFDSIEGVRHAIHTGKRLREEGHPFLGIRLDSGDLAELSITARKMLDEEGFQDTKIYASNELDETLIAELKRQGARIDIWGVGTNLVTGKDQAALDGVYKLSALEDRQGEWEYKLKLSEQMTKVSNPGILQIRRFFKGETPSADVIYDLHHFSEDDCHLVDPLDPTKEKIIRKNAVWKDLLEPVFRKGKLVYKLPKLSEVRNKCVEELARFPVGMKRFLYPHQYVVGLERRIYEIKVDLIKQLRKTYDIQAPN
jgi:nicotinate phosphoribosyltransferase